MLRDHLPIWTWVSPLAGWLLLATSLVLAHPLFVLALGAGLIACVLAAVHHAKVVAHRVGEPFGTLVLALAVTVIEVALIVSLMLASGDAAAALARDTIFAAIMIILNGMVGLCLLVGGSRHGEQAFGLYGVNAALATLATMAVITLILPNTTTTIAGPMYSASQLVLIAVVTLVLYGSFVLVQTIRHRDYFLPPGHAEDDTKAHAVPPSTPVAALSAALLLACLGAVVLLAKTLSPTIEVGINAAGAPRRSLGSSSPPSCCCRRALLRSGLPVAIGCKRASISRSARRWRPSG
jgi:Ca2+:H+ antiporter